MMGEVEMHRYIFIIGLLLTSNVIQANEQTVWDLLTSDNHFALIRHALAPGGGDPEHFDVDDCSTQRNLSDEGRVQARSMGDRFREDGVESARVFSSQWCRCLETAQLMSLGEVEEFTPLNSFFQAYEREAQQTQALSHWLIQQDLSSPVILVTHQVNITALAGVFPSSGEIVVVKRNDTGGFELAGRYSTR